MEEAKELADRRAGRTPVTQHDPFDFLNMPEPEPAPPPRPGDSDWAPKPTGAEDVRRADAAMVLSWLRALARHDLALLDQVGNGIVLKPIKHKEDDDGPANEHTKQSTSPYRCQRRQF